MLKVLPLLCALLIAPAPAAMAENLFDPRGADLFTDLKARHVGDILTVLINESTRARRGARTEAEKSPEYSGGLNVTGFFDVILDLPKIEPLESLDIDPKEEFESEASTEASGSFTGKMTVMVVEVLPNGNLVIEGRRAIQVNKEEEFLILKGIVRPYDISTDNMVLSSEIADSTIEYTGKGTVSSRQKDGLLSKLFNWLF
ncbi:MAG TPA: flagellar basal body L-ring protein FlgH [bacterium]|nr:flagellar basal body L-ring protein FlgH [bacterium]